MPYFPQLATGAMGQYPVVKRRRARTVINTSADGRRVKLADAGAAETVWELRFEELTDAELETLEGFFEGAEGRLGSFTFLDPTANLLTWSESFGNAAWEKGPLVTCTAGVADPWGTQRGWRLSNTGAAAAQVAQTLEVPAWFWYCTSVYLRGGGATLVCGDASIPFTVGAQWRRVSLANQGQSTAETVRFGMELAAGAAVEVSGMQVEAQTGASGYKKTLSRGGVYEGARLDQDELRVTTAGEGRHACEVTVIHGDGV